MPPRPVVEPLPIRHRRWVFIATLIAFVLAVPAFVFYAIGYRFDLGNEISNFRAVGGMYISAEGEDTVIYINDEPVESMRIFQNAAYIQNLEAGLHQVHVQGEGVETWVKVLPVYAHLVTEARSFTLPRRPQVRWVSEYLTPSGASVVTPGATSTLAFASTTNIFFASSTVATSTLERNIEYTFVESLFASTTAARADLAEQLRLQAERFRFGSGTSTLATTTATTTKEFRDVRLYQAGDDVYAQWLGSENDRPHYYCVNYRGEEAMRLAYGSHVLESLRWQLGTSTDLTDPELVGQRLCRDTIRIDRIGQSVQHFDFLPGSEHHVLMHLQDGVYVVEVDDRSWQNVQLLYPGDYLQVVVNEGQIFILDDERYLQVYPELQE